MKAKADEYKLDEEQDTAVRRPLVSGGLVPGSPRITKPMDAQVPFFKWHSICI